MRTLLIALSFIVGLSLTAQSNIAVGQPAPKINVTNWLANKPADESLAGKFIVLEFWATWCGPCLKAVPHLNELQSRFDRPDLYFISMTDESADRTETTLRRVNFESMVATDETKQTQIAFGDGQKGLEQFPLTVLIDKDNIVRWIGEPEELTEPLMEAFLAGQKIEEAAAKEEQSPPAAMKTATENAMQTLLRLNRDTTIKQHLGIEENPAGPTPKAMTMQEGIYYYDGVKLKQLLTRILPGERSVVEGAAGERAYTVHVVDRAPDAASKQRLVREIVSRLGLKETVTTEIVPNYTLYIAQPAKMDKAAKGMGGRSEITSTRIRYTGFSMSGLAASFREYTDVPWSFGGDDDGSYSFIIDVTSPATIKRSLEEYGVVVRESSGKFKVVRYEEK